MNHEALTAIHQILGGLTLLVGVAVASANDKAINHALKGAINRLKGTQCSTKS